MTTWVLLRGLARETRHWGRFTGLLRRGVRGDRVLAVDLAGNGQRRGATTPGSVQAIAEDVRQLVAGLAPPPYVLVAVSLGGMVAVEWAAEHPQEIAGCVLVNSSFGRFSPPWQRLRPRALLHLATLLPCGPDAREMGILRLTSNTTADPDVSAAWARFARDAPVTRANMMRQLLAAARYRAPAEAPRPPILVLASARDRLADVRCSRALARAWRCEMREHPTAGHDLPLDDPRWMIAQMLAWHSPRAH
ncbi:MAG TPA: alpha/beta fold hydrolase [Ramlibacter sp.]|nr:alpha/beta fold hydrolase [Ramlibacter sp.]